MRLTLDSTSRMVRVQANAASTPVMARVWHGESDEGLQVACLIVQISPFGAGAREQLLMALQRDHEHPSPMVATAFPTNLVLS